MRWKVAFIAVPITIIPDLPVDAMNETNQTNSVLQPAVLGLEYAKHTSGFVIVDHSQVQMGGDASDQRRCFPSDGR